ncbi:MAG: pyridoxal phosphate-dependent aminotransferase [Bacteroidales bacterium]|jgi:aspartate aminotransferase|nr:pyridoxal phosphate-dependent aminotransferase [Bacteroidales bacterium]
MPAISQRGQACPPSPIRKLVPFSDEAKKRGIKVFHLNIGQPDIETPANVLDKIRNTDLKVVEYSHSAGTLSYRKKLVEYYSRVGVTVSPDEMIVTTGGSEGILFAMITCLNPGEEIIIPEPFYANYNGFAVAAGIVVRPIESFIDNGFALPPISAFEKAITPKTKAIMICNPNNPTGYLYSKEELELLRDIVKKHDLYLFSDEVYREFCYDGKKHFSVMNLEGIEQNVVLLDSISKRYSACGVRIGVMISKNKAVIATALKFAQARLSPPTFGQIAGEEAVNTPESYLKGVLEEYVRRRDIVVESINRMEGCFCPNPGGAFYAVARLPIDDCDIFCQWLLENFSYQGQTVMLAPATGFYATPGQGKNEVRISYVLKVDDLKKAMKCLEEGLKVYPGRTL